MSQLANGESRKQTSKAILTPAAEYILGNIQQSAIDELLQYRTLDECSEHMITLMRFATQSADFSELTEDKKSSMWFVTNLIRAILLDLKNEYNERVS